MFEAGRLQKIGGSASERYAQGRCASPDHTRRWHIQSSPQLPSQAFRKASFQVGHWMSRSWAVLPWHVLHRGHRLVVFSQGGGTSFPPHISPEPAEPQHTPGALQGQSGDPMNTRKPKCSAALEYPFLYWGGCDTTANDNCGRFRRLTWG